MIVNWSEKPFVRLIIPFVIGIVVSIADIMHLTIVNISAIGTFIALFLLYYFKGMLRSYLFRWLPGLLFLVLIFLFGCQLTLHHCTATETMQIYGGDTSRAISIVKLLESTIEKDKTYKAYGLITKIGTKHSLKECAQKVILYFSKDTLAATLKYGDMIICNSEFNDIPPPQNPGEFNYKRYLKFRKVHYRTYLPSGTWKEIEMADGPSVLGMANHLQGYFLEILKKNIPSINEAAVASALLLGYKDYLPTRVKQAYSSTGAMHVLAVSGLHVGIIFVIISHLLNLLFKNTKYRFLKWFAIICFIWLFALVTGLSPSVQRAATMFSFISIGMILNRHLCIYNTLAASAFVLLCINPLMLTEVGFQLSYIAVIGIVYIQPKIYALLFVPNRLLDKLWAITTVSIAAQIATFPISLYYFHQFPTLFLISNLFVIPGAVIILYLGLALFALSPIEFIATLLGKLIYYMILGLNKIIFFLDQLPFSIVQGVDITVLMVILIYMILIFLFIYLATRHLSYLKIVLSLAILLATSNLIESIRSFNQQKIVFYHIPRISALGFFDGKSHYLFADSSLLKSDKKLSYHVKPKLTTHGGKNVHLLSEDVVDTSFNHLLIRQEYIRFFNATIALIKEPLPGKLASRKLSVDYLVLSKNANVTIRSLSTFYNVKKIIFDSTNAKWRIKKWIKECGKLGLPYLVLEECGALQITI